LRVSSFESEDEKNAYFDKCTDDNCDYDTLMANILPKYKGCFKDDSKDRDFLHLVGDNLDVKTCFDKAKKEGYNYVGL
jgi:hypothetical protein